MNYFFGLLTLFTLITTSTSANVNIVISNIAQLNIKEQALPKVQGELKKIDLEQRKLTIKHKDIPNLDMPGMTMVFKADEKIDLSKFKVGDQILFTVDKINGAYTVLTLEK
jgi:Cu(I)/Ag(I) efflux system protein CusF